MTAPRSTPPGHSAPSGSDRSQRALRLLARHFGPSKLKVDALDCERHRQDASEARGALPLCVVLAESALDIELALAVAADAKVPLVPRGAGTGKTGGAVPLDGGPDRSIVLDTLGFSQIKEINQRESLAVVEPGVVLATFQA